MTPRRKTVDTPLGPKEAEPIEVVSSQETFNIYTLEDGAALKLKAVTTEVLRILDMYDEDGNPVYVVRSKNIVTVDAPDNLRKKRGEE